MVLYAVSSVAKIPLWELAYELRWYIVAIMAALGLVTYIPPLVTWIPNLIMGPGRG
jgi:TRAP-type C4-dicarboxylate transport system permease large subunit